jgi:hypothetical protein
MSRSLGVVCAGILLPVLVGCVANSFLDASGKPRYRQVADGTVPQVAAELEAGLREAGIVVVDKHVDGEIRIAGQSKSGATFCLDVKPERTGSGHKAVVCARWYWGETDDQLWQVVVDILKAGDAADDNP